MPFIKDAGKGLNAGQDDAGGSNGVFQPSAGWVIVAFISPVGLDVGQLAARTLGQNSRTTKFAALAPTNLRDRMAAERQKLEDTKQTQLAQAAQATAAKNASAGSWKKPVATTKPRSKK